MIAERSWGKDDAEGMLWKEDSWQGWSMQSTWLKRLFPIVNSPIELHVTALADLALEIHGNIFN